jgi:hypothetical protein
VRTRPPIALVALLVLAAGCSSGSKKTDEAAAGPAVPWTPDQPPQVVQREPVADPCTASDLSVAGKVRFVPRLTGGIALIGLRNSGTRVCRLTGTPTVDLVHPGDVPKQEHAAFPPTPTSFPDVPYPPSSLLALRPGEPAAVTIVWDNWCDPTTGKSRVAPKLRLTLPHGGGHLDADYNAVVDCISPERPTTLGVSAFQEAHIRPGKPWPGAASLRASLPGPPAHARRGGIARYRVVLRNVSQKTVRFDTCPAYEQQLAPAGRVEVYDLDCAAAHPIAPGKELAFAMQLRVPKNALLGPNGLFWALDALGARIPGAHGRIVVDG